MKHLFLIGGPMGVGKTATCRELQKLLPNNVFLDGDWCWDMKPFTVTDETKKMVQQNICFLLNNFLHCSAYENVIFCWVMHMQPIIDELLSHLDTDGVQVHIISLIADPDTLTAHIMKDVVAGLRTEDVIARSHAYRPLYDALNSAKVDVSHITAAETANQICRIAENRP